jgi:hypothetical protein
VVGSCEHGDEPSGSIECREFLDWLSVLLVSQEGLCFMDLVVTRGMSLDSRLAVTNFQCITTKQLKELLLFQTFD